MEDEPEAGLDTAGMSTVPEGESGLAATATYAVEVAHARKPVVVEGVDSIEVLRGGELVLGASDGGWLAVFANGEWRNAIAQAKQDGDDA